MIKIKLIISLVVWLFCMVGLFFVIQGCTSNIWDNQVDYTTNVTIIQTNINTNSTITIVIGGGTSYTVTNN